MVRLVRGEVRAAKSWCSHQPWSSQDLLRIIFHWVDGGGGGRKVPGWAEEDNTNQLTCWVNIQTFSGWRQPLSIRPFLGDGAKWEQNQKYQLFHNNENEINLPSITTLSLSLPLSLINKCNAHCTIIIKSETESSFQSRHCQIDRADLINIHRRS